MGLNAESILNAIEAYPCLYEDRSGRVFIGQAVSGIAQSLRENGWKRVSNLDERDLQSMDLEIIEAQYVGGARKTGRFVPTVFAREA